MDRTSAIARGAVVLAIGVVVVLIARVPRRAPTEVSPRAPQNPAATIPPQPPPTPSLAATRDRLLARSGDARALLDALDRELMERGRGPASDAIRGFLATGLDAPTGTGLQPGPGGTLAAASSLRVHLLDVLARIDPENARTVARVILGTSASPDEWAIALRTLVEGGGDGRAETAAKLHELLAREDWQRAPTAGYLEAFDIAVALGGSGFVPDLAGLLRRTDSPALSHAGYLAMDRLATRDAGAILPSLVADPSLLAGREAARAGLMARADIRDPVQRGLLESYLADPRFAETELRHFAGVYPNDNAFVSANLVTPTLPEPRRDRPGHDAAALLQIEAWIADPRFAARRPVLETMRDRLRQFARPGP